MLVPKDCKRLLAGNNLLLELEPSKGGGMPKKNSMCFLFYFYFSLIKHNILFGYMFLIKYGLRVNKKVILSYNSYTYW